MRKRIFFYSHDTFGLGHIRRTGKLANTIAGPEHSILIACSSPKASSFVFADGVDFLKLPGFAKLSDGTYRPRNMGLPLEEFVNLRANLLLSTVRNFRPDIIVVDKEPLGVKKELLPTLEYVRNIMPECRTICGLRDILDSYENVKNEWEKRGTQEALENYYDQIFIYGQKDIFDFKQAYKLADHLDRKMFYTGYIGEDSAARNQDFILPPNERPLITFTAGGGEDGQGLMEVVHDFFEENAYLPGHDYRVLTGPFIDRGTLRKLKDLELKFPFLKVDEFIDQTFSLFLKSQIVISMGGHNSMTELALMGKRCIIVPRVKPRVEQLIRAQVFKSHGLCDYIHPQDLTTQSLKDSIELNLRKPDMTNFLSGTGHLKFKSKIQQLLYPFEGSVSSDDSLSASM